MLTYSERRLLVEKPFLVVVRHSTSYPHGGTQVDTLDNFFHRMFVHKKSGSDTSSWHDNAIADLEDESWVESEESGE